MEIEATFRLSRLKKSPLASLLGIFGLEHKKRLR